MAIYRAEERTNSCDWTMNLFALSVDPRIAIVSLDRVGVAVNLSGVEEEKEKKGEIKEMFDLLSSAEFALKEPI